jgi:hypothetical protein
MGTKMGVEIRDEEATKHEKKSEPSMDSSVCKVTVRSGDFPLMLYSDWRSKVASIVFVR